MISEIVLGNTLPLAELISLSFLNLIGRRRLQQIQLVKGPNRIVLTLEDLTFINPQLSKKVSGIAVSQESNSTSAR